MRARQNRRVTPRPLLIITALVVVAGALASCTTEKRALPIPLPDTAETSSIYDTNGTQITKLQAEQNRISVPLKQVPASMQNAIVSIEDRRFWEHNGVDPRAIARAVKENNESGQVSQGGSTITQQYVKNALLGDDETLSRKLEEAALSMEIERTYSKERILELYLNTVYFGNGASGIEAAANTYFGVSSNELNLTQAAMLAGIVQSPSLHDPYKHAKNAKQRRDTVLRAMLDEGYISPTTAKQAEAAALGVIPKGQRPGEAAYPAGHFVSEVREWFLDNPEFGTTRAERGVALRRWPAHLHDDRPQHSGSGRGRRGRAPPKSRVRRRSQRQQPRPRCSVGHRRTSHGFRSSHGGRKGLFRSHRVRKGEPGGGRRAADRIELQGHYPGDGASAGHHG